MPLALELGLVILVVSAAVSDLAARRIPNWITLPGALAGIALQAWYGGAQGAIRALGTAALGFAIFMALYLLGGMGAGDVKLFAAVGAFLAPHSLPWVFILTGLLGGVAALALAAARGRLMEVLRRTGHIVAGLGLLRWREVRQASRLDAPNALRLPYGAVIAGGTLLFLAMFH
jgi:prepilin peptidase CpaA